MLVSCFGPRGNLLTNENAGLLLALEKQICVSAQSSKINRRLIYNRQSAGSYSVRFPYLIFFFVAIWREIKMVREMEMRDGEEDGV
jgi:hypothetical protein